MRARFFLVVLAAAALASLLPASGAADTTTVFGPKKYTRAAGPPQTFTENFERCGTAECEIAVTNGNADGTNRVSSASISLNGIQVLGPSDFNPQTAQIVKPVVLAADNQLTVTLASKPGSFVIIEIRCAASPAVLSLGPPGVSVPSPTILFVAVPIVNGGTAAAVNVQVTAISLTGATLTSPALPLSLGTIPAGGSAVLNASFSGAFLPGATPVLTVEGTFAVGDVIFCFSLSATLVIPPGSPGSAQLRSVSVMAHGVSGGGFPPQPPGPDEETNPGGWTVPIAPFVPGTPTATQFLVMPAPFGDPPAIVFEANNGLGVTDANTIAEPSGASGGGVIFSSFNSRAAYSTNGGGSFTEIDPTTIFPNDAVGFCCDQIVQYAPSINRFIWLLQGPNFVGYRLAVARPVDIVNSGATAWTYWNLTPGLFGQPAGAGFDYPDLSLGNNELYMSWDAGAGGCPPGCSKGLQVARTTLAGLAAGGTITIEFTTPSDSSMAWGSHLTQDTGDEIFWAGHNNNSSMRVFSLKEGSNTYFWRSVGISSWATSGLSSTTPDGKDWLTKLSGFPGNALIGSTRVGNNQLWFAWSAGTNTRFPMAHIEMVNLDPGNNFSKTAQVQIWNGSYAFAYPSLSTNICTGEIGMSFEYGGNGNYENHVVGFWGDFVAYITTGSDVGTTRFGDYVTIRQAPVTVANPGNLFTAFGYGLNLVSGISRSDVHYVLFGRPSSSCVIIK